MLQKGQEWASPLEDLGQGFPFHLPIMYESFVTVRKAFAHQQQFFLKTKKQKQKNHLFIKMEK